MFAVIYFAHYLHTLGRKQAIILLKDRKKLIPFAHSAEKYAVIAREGLRIIQCFQVRLFVLPQHAQEAAEQPHIPEKLRMRH